MSVLNGAVGTHVVVHVGLKLTHGQELESADGLRHITETAHLLRCAAASDIVVGRTVRIQVFQLNVSHILTRKKRGTDLLHISVWWFW